MVVEVNVEAGRRWRWVGESGGIGSGKVGKYTHTKS